MIKYYTNAKLISLDPSAPYLENAYLKTDGTKIAGIGDMQLFNTQAVEPDAELEDVKGKIIMPGMVCTHSHFYGQLIRGMAVHYRLRNWQNVLQQLWWNVDRALDEEMNYASAVMGLVEGVKCGVTTFIDHHASPSCCPGSLDILEEAVKKVGARAVLAYETSDRNGEQSCKEGLAENARFLEKCKGRGEADTVRGMFGLHALYSLSESTLKQAAEIESSFNTGFHIHCAEDIADVVGSYKAYDMHVVEYLYKMGILKDKSILAHFVHTGPEEWKLVAETGTTIAHNPQSNSNNAVGICPVDAMLRSGVHVALGGDGFYYDLFQELNIAMILQKLGSKNPGAMGGDLMTKLSFENPYRVVSQAFSMPAGQLKAGCAADFIMLNYIPPTPLHAGNIMSHITSAFTGHVSDTVINGKRVVKDGIVLGISETEAFSNCRSQAKRLEEKYRLM
ncbi:MAG: amidohydrolase family protein [Oscillospiraceae bacterium]|nr:amidohydrolase family protein [Oscillospiraceae bacterium]